MSKTPKSNESNEFSEIMSYKEFDQIKKDLSKDLKMLKPRKPNLPTEKRLTSMSQKKAEGVFDESKKMLKDQIEFKLLQKADRELTEGINPTQKTPTQPNVVQAAPIQQQSIKQSDEMFKGITPKDLKGVDNNILEKYMKMKVIEQNPGLAPYLNDTNKKSDLKELLEVVNLIVDLKGGNTNNQNVAQQTKSENESILKYMMEQQKETNKMQMEWMKQTHEEREERLLEKIDELKSQASVNPYEWLMNKKDELQALKGFLVEGPNVDGATQVHLEELKGDQELKRMKYNDKIAQHVSEQNKSSEFTTLIKEGMNTFSKTISEAIGGAIGQMGKQQLDSAQLPAFVPIEQIANQIGPIQPAQQTNKKDYKDYGGFRVSETK